MDPSVLSEALEKRSEPKFRLKQALHAVYSELAESWDKVTVLSKDLRAYLTENVPFSTLTIEEEKASDDGSVKLRLSTADGYPIEAVLLRFDMPHAKEGEKSSRYTACLSSQSGCALACTFCATGRMGFGRNLTSSEIVDQFLELARRRAKQGGRIDNVVMMGMGEPFHNYENVIEALKILNDPDGCELAARRIAISTAGWIPGIEKLTQEPRQFKLALSLHAPNDELRKSLMPVNKRFPIEKLMQACREYRSKTKRRIFVEYLMLQGINDQPEHAKELADLLGTDGFHVNLIAYNPTDTDYVASNDDTVRNFAKILQDNGVKASYRVSRARDISGACGQLAAPVAKKRVRS